MCVCVCVFFWEYLLRKTWNVISVFGSSCGLFGHCNNTVPNWKPSLVGSKFQGVTSYLIQSVHRSPSKSQIHKSDHKSYPPHMTSLLMPPSLDFQPGTSKCCIFANLPLCETEGAPSWDLFLQNSNEVHPDPSIAEACLPSFEKKNIAAVTVFKAISGALLSLLISTKKEISKGKLMRHGGILRESSRNFTSTPKAYGNDNLSCRLGGVWSVDSISSFPSSRNMHGNVTTLVAQKSLSFFHSFA